MKRWQKIASIIFIILLVTAHIAVFSDYASLVEATGIWDAHLDEEWFFYYFGKYRHHFYAYHLLSLTCWMN